MRAWPRVPGQGSGSGPPPGRHSAPPAGRDSAAYSCRHGNTPGAENAQAAATINLPVHSQTDYGYARKNNGWHRGVLSGFRPPRAFWLSSGTCPYLIRPPPALALPGCPARADAGGCARRDGGRPGCWPGARGRAAVAGESREKCILMARAKANAISQGPTVGKKARCVSNCAEKWPKLAPKRGARALTRAEKPR